MKKLATALAVVLIMACGSGCLDLNKVLAWSNDTSTDLLGREASLVATLAEIDAVAELKSDTGKYNGFMSIAKRPGLEVEAQQKLVKAVYDGLYFEDARGDVLIGLVENPSFTHEAKKRILDRLSELGTEEQKVRVLAAIQSRRIGVNEAMGERLDGLQPVSSQGK